MSAQIYLLVIGAIAVAACVLVLWRDRQRGLKENWPPPEEENSWPVGVAVLTFELSARLFGAEDSDFVASETSPQMAQSFRRERATLALDWLREVRRYVSLMMRAYRRLARSNADLTPAGELKLGFEFLLFQATTGVLYLVIRLIGPLHAAKLVRYSLELAGQVRKLSEDILPAGTRVAAELLDIEGQTKNRAATL